MAEKSPPKRSVYIGESTVLLYTRDTLYGMLNKCCCNCAYLTGKSMGYRDVGY
jgi:hypothetical protein